MECIICRVRRIHPDDLHSRCFGCRSCNFENPCPTCNDWTSSDFDLCKRRYLAGLGDRASSGSVPTATNTFNSLSRKSNDNHGTGTGFGVGANGKNSRQSAGLACARKGSDSGSLVDGATQKRRSTSGRKSNAQAGDNTGSNVERESDSMAEEAGDDGV